MDGSWLSGMNIVKAEIFRGRLAVFGSGDVPAAESFLHALGEHNHGNELRVAVRLLRGDLRSLSRSSMSRSPKHSGADAGGLDDRSAGGDQVLDDQVGQQKGPGGLPAASP